MASGKLGLFCIKGPICRGSSTVVEVPYTHVNNYILYTYEWVNGSLAIHHSLVSNDAFLRVSADTKTCGSAAVFSIRVHIIAYLPYCSMII